MRSDTERGSRQSPIAGKLTLALPARAKLNLDLKIAGPMPDGFHELVSTMQAIALHDLVVVAPAPHTSLTSDGLMVPSGADNSVLKAHAALEAATHRALPAHFHLHKRIPPGSGMGGASSDAAAALIALKAIYRLDVDLAPVALEAGADVPFFLHGGRARAEGRGERLTALPDQQAWFAIAWPRIELSTASVYRAWDEVKGEGPNELQRAAQHVDSRVRDFAHSLGNQWQMTGSGSAFFTRCDSEAEARSAATALDCWTAVTCSVARWA